MSYLICGCICAHACRPIYICVFVCASALRRSKQTANKRMQMSSAAYPPTYVSNERWMALLSILSSQSAMMSPWTLSEPTSVKKHFALSLSFASHFPPFPIALTRLPPSSPNSFGETTFFLSSLHSLLSLHAPPPTLSPFRFLIQARSVPGSLALIESAHVKRAAKSTRMFWLRRALF